MIGTRLGHYEVTAHLGSGGMGDVYQATDTRLGRQVAVKLLPAAVAQDSERQARFAREARVLAALNHPNIAAIHGLEEADGRAFLVMELVPGTTLAEALDRGPMPFREALGTAAQIAEALDAAHQRAVIHRDLKPANVKITPEGKVKVLDFGLAKAFDNDASSPNLSNSPTLGVAATQAGVILGTAAYMSPEQARGRAVDKRTDIWSFGCVLFEMLTGRQVFVGETASDTLAKILEREPAWDLLPPDTPASIGRLLRRLLQKDARQRLHDIADARLEIEEALAAPAVSFDGSPPPSARWFSPLHVLAAAALVILTAGVTTLVRRPTVTENGPVIRFPVVMPPTEEAGYVTVSPDGRTLAIASLGGQASVWLHSLELSEIRRVPGGEDAWGAFFSPDSRSMGIIGRDRKLRRVDLAGGSPVILAEGADFGSGGSWSRDGVILITLGSTIRRVSASTGVANDVKLDDGASAGALRASPRFLPDGQHFLYWLADGGQQGVIRVGSIASSETRLLAPADSPAEYSGAGYLLFLRGALLLAQPFDASTLTLSGEAMPVATDAVPGTLTGWAQVSAPGKELLAYVRTRSGKDGQLKWFDRSGRELGTIVPPAGSDYLNPSLSPDETRVAVNQMDPHTGNWDVWTIDLASQIPTRLTSDPAQDSDAVWSPDSSEIVFVSARGGQYGLYRKRLRGAGAEELLLKTASEPHPTDWTVDGRFLIYELDRNVYALPMTGETRAPMPIAASPFVEYGAKTSADGRWIAYGSTESGTYQVYIQAFPGPGDKIRVSTVYGIHPRWRRDGRELIYWEPPSALRSVDLTYEGGTIRASPPKWTLPPHVGIVDVADSRHHHAMTADAQRFLVRQAANAGPPIKVVTNWTLALPK